jgi:hypothetical protein
MTKAATATTEAPTFTPGPLPILFSSRIRLSDSQRAQLKAAYHRLMNEHSPAPGARIGGSSVTTVTHTTPPIFRQFPSIVMSDLIGSRESIPLTTVLALQQAFGIEVVSKADLLAAAEHYITYVCSQDYASK